MVRYWSINFKTDILYVKDAIGIKWYGTNEPVFCIDCCLYLPVKYKKLQPKLLFENWLSGS